MKVRIVSVNIAARQLNVTPAESLAKEPKSPHKNKTRKKRTKPNKRSTTARR
jgi:hypothetical protein